MAPDTHLTFYTMKIQLSNGEAEIADFVSRKAHREWKIALWKDREERMVTTIDKDTGEKNQELKSFFSEESAERSRDVLVMNMLTSLTLNGAKVELSEAVIESMGKDDYETIYEACLGVMLRKEEAKKKS